MKLENDDNIDGPYQLLATIYEGEVVNVNRVIDLDRKQKKIIKIMQSPFASNLAVETHRRGWPADPATPATLGGDPDARRQCH